MFILLFFCARIKTAKQSNTKHNVTTDEVLDTRIESRIINLKAMLCDVVEYGNIDLNLSCVLNTLIERICYEQWYINYLNPLCKEKQLKFNNIMESNEVMFDEYGREDGINAMIENDCQSDNESVSKQSSKSQPLPMRPRERDSKEKETDNKRKENGKEKEREKEKKQQSSKDKKDKNKNKNKNKSKNINDGWRVIETPFNPNIFIMHIRIFDSAFFDNTYDDDWACYRGGSGGEKEKLTKESKSFDKSSESMNGMGMDDFDLPEKSPSIPTPYTPHPQTPERRVQVSDNPSVSHGLPVLPLGGRNINTDNKHNKHKRSTVGVWLGKQEKEKQAKQEERLQNEEKDYEKGQDENMKQIDMVKVDKEKKENELFLIDIEKIVVSILKKHHFKVCHVLRSLKKKSKKKDDENNMEEENKNDLVFDRTRNGEQFERARICVTVNIREIKDRFCWNGDKNDDKLSKFVKISVNEIMNNVKYGFYRLQFGFYPCYHACKHRFSNDFFNDQGWPLRDSLQLSLFGNDDLLSKRVLSLVLLKQPSDLILSERFALLSKLQDILESVHKGAKFEIFGSMATGLDHIDSDLDISIHLAENKDDNDNNNNRKKNFKLERQRIVTILDPIAMILQEQEDLYKSEYFKWATVPIIKLQENRLNGLEADISVCRDESVLKTKLIKKYVSIDWRVRPLVLAIKNWVKKQQLNDTHRGDVNSFGYTLMIIQYLQMQQPNPILPCLKVDFVNDAQNGNVINIDSLDWINCQSFVNFGCKNESTLGQLFKGFFTFYNQIFDAKRDAISVGSGKLIDKNSFQLHNNQNTELIIQDPIDPMDNVARRATKPSLKKMLDAFAVAVNVLSA